MKTIPILTAICFLILNSPDAYATKVKSVNLEQMVQGADRIFVGTCVAVEDDTAPGTEIPVTTYTFSVSERIKGVTGDILTVRQFGVRQPRVQGDQALVFRIPGMPVYQVGQEVVLFLIADSSLGLTSPVGLSQGAFTIEERDGRKVLQNGNQNLGLFKDLSPEASAKKWQLSEKEVNLFSVKKGPIDPITFIGVVRKMAASPQ